MDTHAPVIPPGAGSPLPRALAIPIAAVVLVISTVEGIRPRKWVPPPGIVIGESTPTISMSWRVSACHAGPDLGLRPARYRQTAPITGSATRIHDPLASVIGPVTAERGATCRCDRARCMSNPVASEPANAHSSTAAHSTADMTHAACPSHCVAALRKGSIRSEGCNRQNRAACDEELFHNRSTGPKDETTRLRRMPGRYARAFWFCETAIRSQSCCRGRTG